MPELALPRAVLEPKGGRRQQQHRLRVCVEHSSTTQALDLMEWSQLSNTD